MTDYLEEMMRTAGVEPDTICKYAAGNIVYPDFTPEKQLEIIKLIGSNVSYMNIEMGFDDSNNEYTLVSSIKNNTRYEGYAADFSQALAQLTTELMKAGELDKEKVKEILE